MISKKKIAVSLAGVASMLVVGAASLGASSASAAGPAACGVTSGQVRTNQAITATQGSGGGKFTSTTITCVSPDAAINGTWSGIGATFTANSGGNCATETGGGTFTSGTTPTGASVGGSFSFTRAGSHVHVDGNLNGIHFYAELEFAPTPPETCATNDLRDATLDGTAVVGA